MYHALKPMWVTNAVEISELKKSEKISLCRKEYIFNNKKFTSFLHIWHA
jgi:hypothetical protein